MFAVSREMAIAVTRTGAAYLWVFLLERFAFDVPEDLRAAFILIAGTALYYLIRLIAERVPVVGWLLVVNQKPHYDQ